MRKKYKFLEPYTFANGVKVKNRVVIPPMTEASGFEEGSITSDELRYFRMHSGGAGLFISPVANVSVSGKGFAVSYTHLTLPTICSV